MNEVKILKANSIFTTGIKKLSAISVINADSAIAKELYVKANLMFPEAAIIAPRTGM